MEAGGGEEEGQLGPTDSQGIPKGSPQESPQNSLRLPRGAPTGPPCQQPQDFPGPPGSSWDLQGPPRTLVSLQNPITNSNKNIENVRNPNKSQKFLDLHSGYFQAALEYRRHPTSDWQAAARRPGLGWAFLGFPRISQNFIGFHRIVVRFYQDYTRIEIGLQKDFTKLY